MRKIRDVLRLTFENNMSYRMIGKAVGISRKAVADYLLRASNANLCWPLPEELDDAALEEQLFPSIKKRWFPVSQSRIGTR